MNKRLSRRLGIQVARIRKTVGVSQEQLAEKVGVWPETISRLERGLANPSLDTLGQISKALSVELNELLNFGPQIPGSGAVIEALVLELANRPESHVKFVHEAISALLRLVDEGLPRK